ncbi:hypothetical protein OG225_42965 (plasmid) [Nocardia sp. NBC_01377]|uniref:hypothetical protein n=1 Tax=Nocardia sp. NBC_01377 TaxID=2903595 RepID=UPI00324ABB2D
MSIDTADAVTVMRTIDTLMCELLSPAESARYTALWSSDRDGRVVRGLLLIRNSEVHRHAPIDVDTDRVVSGPRDYPWRVFPQWKEYADLPAEVRHGEPNQSRTPHDRYRDSVAGRPVVETLLDAMRFFDRCDPSLTRRADDGDIARFPLEEYIQHTYECRHPYWPRAAEHNDLLLDGMTLMSPTGRSRQVRRAVLLDDMTLYAGLTDLGYHSASFAESADQIAWDVAGGFPYTAVTKAGEVVEIIERDRILMAGETALSDVDLADTVVGSGVIDQGEDSDDWIRTWWTEQLGDAYRYGTQRRPAA